MATIKGHTVGNDGVVYNPDTADWGYVGALDSRNSPGRRQEYVSASWGSSSAVAVKGLAVKPKPVAKASGKGVPGVGGGGSSAGGKSSRARGSQLTIEPPDYSKLMPKDGPLKRVGIGQPQEALGAISDIGWIRTNNGYMVTVSQDAKERLEDDELQEMQWAFRNQIGPWVGYNEIPFPGFLGHRENYDYDWITMEVKPKPGTVRNVGGGF